MRVTALPIIVLAVTASLFFSCKREVENYKMPFLSSGYLPLQPGKYITYRLDSLVFPNLGRSEEVHAYQEMDVVDSVITDNLGHPSYRMFRYLRDTAGMQPWQPSTTYFITADSVKAEVVDNNLRFLKIYFPQKTGLTWKGNEYLPPDPFGSYGFHQDISYWTYHYKSLNDTVAANGFVFNNVASIVAVDEQNLPDTIAVTTNNQVQVPANTPAVWIRGRATDTISILTSPLSQPNFLMTIYNRSNLPAKLNNIFVPVNMGRTYEYVNGAWVFGDKDSSGNRVDIVRPDLPYGSKSYAVDKYAKGIGLVQQELTLWEFQPNPGGNSPFKDGFGVKRTILDHN